MQDLYFYNPQDQLNYFSGEPVCEECRLPIIDMLFVRTITPRKGKDIILHYCMNCAPKFKNSIYPLEQWNTFQIVDKIPDGSIIRNVDRTGLTQKKDLDLFEAADKNIDGEQIIDNMKLAGRQSWHGVSIGADIKERIKELDSPLTDVHKYLKNIKNSKIAIEEKQTKRIEGV